jgi:hypothetical protein
MSRILTLIRHLRAGDTICLTDENWDELEQEVIRLSALDDQFAAKFIELKGTIPEDIDLGYGDDSGC